MTATKTNKHHLNNAIGIVSDSRVVVHNGKDSSVIKIDEIKKINLIKKRRFELNLLFLLTAFVFTWLLVYDLQLDLLLKLLLLALIAVAFGMAISYKSYGYQVRIGLIGEKTLVVRAGRSRKEQLKYFYYAIRRKLRGHSLDRSGLGSDHFAVPLHDTAQ